MEDQKSQAGSLCSWSTPATRVGKATAITATARKLALLVYRVLRGDISYSDPGAEAYAQMHRTRMLKALRKRAQQLGLQLLDPTSGEVLGGAVS